MTEIGDEMHSLCRRLFPICRSITGAGLRESISILKEHLPNLIVHEVPTGTPCFDWEIPQEWNVKDAYVMDPSGRKVIDFKASNLHLIGYSVPINTSIPLSELQNHLYSLPDQPDAIPYVTSYYQRRWGFCISERERNLLNDGIYKVVIDSSLANGSLTYGELLIPGERAEEVFISTYLCHPSMANNELSGPVVSTFLAKWLTKRRNRHTYRIVLIPETIGSITYLSRNLEHLKSSVVAGFNVSCVGDDRAYSYLPSRKGDTIADQVAKHVLKHMHPEFVRYSYLDRGSDERQYCSPGVDLPICSLMRTKYGCYPEYHTSLDDLSLVTPDGLEGGYNVLKKAIECLETNEKLRTTVLCEPQLGKRGLYPTLSTKSTAEQVKKMMSILAFADGCNSLLDIANFAGFPMWELSSISKQLQDAGLLEIC